INRFPRFVRRELHTPQTPKDAPHLAPIPPRQGSFDPFERLYRLTILRFRHLVEVLGPVIVVEPLTRLGEQRLHVFPDPLGPIGHHTQPDVVFGNQAGLFDLRTGLPALFLCVHLMPTQQMDDALTMEEIEAKPFGIAPLVAPASPSRPVTRLPW